MISFDLLKDLEVGYNMTRDLMNEGRLDEARALFSDTKVLEEDIIDLLEDMLYFDNGTDDNLVQRIKGHLRDMSYFSRKSKILYSELYVTRKS